VHWTGLLLLAALVESAGLAMDVPALTILLGNDAAAQLRNALGSMIDSYPTETPAIFITALFALLFVLKHVITIIKVGYWTAVVYRLRNMWGKPTFAS